MHENVLETIGTPLVEVKSPAGATVAAKLESKNPGGSAKDRPALQMVEAAEREGLIEPGDHLVEPTSGNTGIGLAMVSAVKGYEMTIVMPSDKSPERRQIMRAYGADIELVDGDMTTARELADELEEERGYVQLRQFENPANVEAHYRTTAEEILRQVGDREVDALVATIGTGGTITGTARRLREEFPEMEVVGVEPESNAVLSTGESGQDDFQGMGPGFVSDILEVDLLSDVETVALENAETECRRLAREGGMLVGQSAGGASLAAYRVAERLVDDGEREDPLVVTVFPDSGERYMSTGLYE
jgi:cysteine synthase A